jgi:hypothetical protein
VVRQPPELLVAGPLEVFHLLFQFGEFLLEYYYYVDLLSRSH